MGKRILTTLLLIVAVAALALGDVPSQVKSRLTKIDGYMTKVESALAQGKADRNSLDWAKETLKEIEDRYPASLSEPEVRSAIERIQKGEKAIAALEGKKADDKAAQEKEEKDVEAVAEGWAIKMEPYKADTREGTKGYFGVPTMDVAKIHATKNDYLEAKKLYEEFLATKIDPDSHWRLRQAAWDIKVAIDNYGRSIDNIVQSCKEPLTQAREWIAGQKGKNPPLIHSSGRMMDLADQIGTLRNLLPAGDPRLVEMEGVYKGLLADQTELEKIVLKSRKMKPDVYKGGDAATIKALSSKIVTEEVAKTYKDAAVKPTLKIVRTHITSSSWDTESALEWTDTTKSALQYRTSKGVFVQVACMIGNDCFVYTLYVHRDRINGNTGNLTGHAMHRDKFLKENLPK